MTKEERKKAIEVLEDMKVKIDIPKAAKMQNDRNWALDVAIKTLEQEPCDVISRKYLLDNCVVDKVTMPYVPVNKIKEAPPVTQKPNLELICEELAAENDKLIEQLKQKSGKWIPVSERLPEENETVLINYCKLNEHSVRMAIWDELHCRFYNSEYTKYVSVDFVTAWMPLPKPYEPQESEDINV